MQKVSIIIPVYNEEEAIEQVIDSVKKTMGRTKYKYEIIVVDDGSTDRTPEIIKSKGIRVIRHPVNKGPGASRKTGILNATGEWIVAIDADGTYSSHDIPRLLEHLPRFDQVVGTRTSERGTIRLLRTPAKWFIRKLACFLTNTEISDLNSGLRAFKKDIMLKFLHLIPEGFSCVTTMTLSFLCNGYTIKYIPISYYKRVGKSKFHPIKDTYNYLLLVIRMVMYFNPLKVFIPLSLSILLLGIGKFVYDIINLRRIHITTSMVILVITSALIGTVGLLADLIVVQHKERTR